MRFLWLFVNQQKLKYAISDSLGIPTENQSKQKNSAQKCWMGQLKCNSSKLGNYRVILISILYIT